MTTPEFIEMLPEKFRKTKNDRTVLRILHDSISDSIGLEDAMDLMTFIVNGKDSFGANNTPKFTIIENFSGNYLIKNPDTFIGLVRGEDHLKIFISNYDADYLQVRKSYEDGRTESYRLESILLETGTHIRNIVKDCDESLDGLNSKIEKYKALQM